jgi:hypothetical protein
MTICCPLCGSAAVVESEMEWTCQKCHWVGSTPHTKRKEEGVDRSGAFGLPWALKILRWSVIAFVAVAAVVLIVFFGERVNYAPMWFRVYDSCMEAQPDAKSITQAFRRRPAWACMRRASRVTNKQLQWDKIQRRTLLHQPAADTVDPRGPKGK